MPAGSVLTLPEIDLLERRADGLRLHFVVSAELEYFDGHFREVPVLPGVVQIGWALELARLHLEAAVPAMERFHSLAAVKFMRVIQPGASVWLRLQVQDGELHFEYRAGDDTCSTGRVLFH
jgi:3-hydroxymyristoyl/3-hydroxydecanoyl-(acyl carrier protein) dehydratase